MKDAIYSHFDGHYQDFYLKYLPGLKKIGGSEYSALCPFHEDQKPSFNIDAQKGGYFCHGCGKKGGPFHFYAKRHSMDTKADFGKILRGIANDFGIAWTEEKRRLVKTYDYTDADGRLLFQVCRYEPKDFRQRRPNGSGGWIYDLKGIEPVLYRLPQIHKASEVIIVEGEKDADSLFNLGFAATTAPMGAKKWREQYNPCLRGKSIVLMPDNDTQGLEHMVSVAKSINGSSAGLKLLRLPGLASKGDVSDFIAGFKDPEEAAERLAIMIEEAPTYQPPKTYSIEDVVVDISEFRRIEIPERRAFLSPWLKEESISMVYGWRGSGKTFFALGLLDCVSRGIAFGPWDCGLSTPCLFLDGEMTISDNHERFDALGLLAGVRKNPFYIYSDHYSNQLNLPRAHLANESWRTKIKSILISKKIKLWVVDNIASLAPGLDENKKQDWDPINQWLLDLRFNGIATVMLHHESKEGKQRGTAAREDNLDVSIRLKLPTDFTPEDGCRFIAHFAKARVATRYLPLVADTEFTLREEDGLMIWRHANVKAEIREEVLFMLDSGADQAAIADTLGISKGYVSKIRKQAITDGLLTPKNKLTPSGFQAISE